MQIRKNNSECRIELQTIFDWPFVFVLDKYMELKFILLAISDHIYVISIKLVLTDLDPKIGRSTLKLFCCWLIYIASQPFYKTGCVVCRPGSLQISYTCWFRCLHAYMHTSATPHRCAMYILLHVCLHKFQKTSFVLLISIEQVRLLIYTVE